MQYINTNILIPAMYGVDHTDIQIYI